MNSKQERAAAGESSRRERASGKREQQARESSMQERDSSKREQHARESSRQERAAGKRAAGKSSKREESIGSVTVVAR